MVRNYKPPVIRWKDSRPSRTVPDQSLSIQEIVKRFVRGIPVDVVQREAVYSDQNDHDLEKLSRMDFGEKAEYARQLSEQAEGLANEIQERQAEHVEREATLAKEKAERIAKKKASKASGIVVP